MKVRDAMAKAITKVKTNDTLKDVARKMKQEDSGFMPVVEEIGRASCRERV